MVAIILPIITTAITITLIVTKISVQNLQLIIAITLVCLLFVLSRLWYSPTERAKKKIVTFVLVFLSSLIVQVLLITSGGFNSPFLPLIHLFIAGSAILLSTSVSISFLLGTLGVLSFQILLSPTVHQIAVEDPWTIALYLVSFIVIVPLAYLLSSTYHLKDTLSSMLNEHIQLGKQREDSILSGLKEMVIVTDMNLHILYVNKSVENETGVFGKDMYQQFFLQVFPLKDQHGNAITPAMLSINQTLIDHTPRTIPNIYFYGKRRIQVDVQTRPIIDAKDQITQIVFVINQSEGIKESPMKPQLEQALERYAAMIDDIRKNVPINATSFLRAKIEFMNKVKEDVLIAQELDFHPIKIHITYQDIALLCKQIVVSKQNLAQSIQIPLRFILDEKEVAESTYLHFAENQPAGVSLPISQFSIPFDVEWTSIILQKIIDIAILLSFGQTSPFVQVTLFQYNLTSIAVEIITSAPYLSENDQRQLFEYHFGTLGTTTPLRFGSGLEGFIIKTISQQLNIPITLKSHTNPNTLTFTLLLNKNPR